MLAVSVGDNHRVKYIFYLESIRPIRTAENFEALLGFGKLHGRWHSRRSSDVILTSFLRHFVEVSK